MGIKSKKYYKININIAEIARYFAVAAVFCVMFICIKGCGDSEKQYCLKTKQMYLDKGYHEDKWGNWVKDPNN